MPGELRGGVVVTEPPATLRHPDRWPASLRDALGCAEAGLGATLGRGTWQTSTAYQGQSTL